MTDSEQKLSDAINNLAGVHAYANAKIHKRFDRLEATIKASRTPAARIKAGSRAGMKSHLLSEPEIQEKYRKELRDPAWSAAFHPARKFAVTAARKSRLL